jgi:hypothetical protein
MEVTLQDVAAQVAAIAKQLEKLDRLDQLVDREEFARRLDQVVDREEFARRLDRLVDREEFAQLEERLKQQAKIYRESLGDDLKKLAEGYGGTLEAIERRLADMKKLLDTRLSDHDLALTNHAKRITALEERR